MQRRSVLTGLAAGMCGAFLPVNRGMASGVRLTGYLRTNWSRDRFSYGSYSYTPRGVYRAANRTLAEPVAARIFFAGEAANPEYSSTVHAAYESAEHAVAALEEEDHEDIAVVGAGISGLRTAQWLADEGYDVTAYEARDRIGGRLWTDRSLGVPLDMGASWIHGLEGNPLVDLADEAGVELIETGDDSVVRMRDGALLAPEEVPDWLEEVISVQHNAGAQRAEINLAAFLAPGDYGGPEAVLREGYDLLLPELAGEYALLTGHDLRRVTLDGDVRLGFADGTEARHDAVVLTVPLGVLQQGVISFVPPLPQRKREAIGALGMGLLDKLYLRFDAPFWEGDPSWIVTADTGLPRGQFNQWLNLADVFGEPILMGINGADAARDLAGLEDEAMISVALTVLERAYGL
ncbi:FAD-dependent oxidoreductase [Nioella aestuarii]|uniref:flavin monoamine oxidase family protein n=1 Tax=Nioella aestuarii TaxID=1662864 RepID=UPI003D7F42A5